MRVVRLPRYCEVTYYVNFTIRIIRNFITSGAGLPLHYILLPAASLRVEL